MHIKDVLRKPCIHCPIVATAEVKVNSGLDKEFDRCKKKQVIKSQTARFWP